MRKSRGNDTIDLDVHMHHETEKAYLLSTTGDREHARWVPKSQVQLERSGRMYRVTMSENLATEKGFA